MSRKTFDADSVKTVGPYSHAAEIDGLVFVSGQIPLDSATGKLVEGSIGDQVRQSFKNLKEMLRVAGLSEKNVIKVNVFLADMADFKEMNDVYAEQFSAPYPARSTIGVAALPLGARVEIELIAHR